MEKSIGKNKIFCAVFISGRGSNLKSIYKYSKKNSSKIKLKLVISDKSNARGITFAKKNNPDGIIPAYVGLHPHSIYGNNYAFLKLDNNKVTVHNLNCI